jgi:hypothetical protein
MSALIISVVLVILSVSISTAGFYSRFNVADSEYKQRSSALAEGCIDAALLRLAQNAAYAPAAGGDVITLDTDTCKIVSVSTLAGQKIIQVQAVYNKAVTNFKIVVDSNSLSLISWEELSTL